MVTISTAGADPDGVLGRLRARALAQPTVDRTGPVTTAHRPALAMLEWSVGDDWDGEDLQPVLDANPASWVTLDGLQEQREAVADIAFRHYHCNQWLASGQHWLPIGAWQKCADPTAKILPQERVYVGVDVCGERSASAVAWVTEDLRVECAVFTGNEAVLEVAGKVRDLAEDFTIAEVVFDPWRFQQGALELAERGIRVTEFPQSNAGRRRSGCTARSSKAGSSTPTSPRSTLTSEPRSPETPRGDGGWTRPRAATTSTR